MNFTQWDFIKRYSRRKIIRRRRGKLVDLLKANDDKRNMFMNIRQAVADAAALVAEVAAAVAEFAAEVADV